MVPTGWTEAEWGVKRWHLLKKRGGEEKKKKRKKEKKREGNKTKKKEKRVKIYIYMVPLSLVRQRGWCG